MPDSELLKLVLQLGSFGLIALAVVWHLFRGAPMLKEALERSAANHQAVVEGVTAAFRQEMREWREWFSRELDRRGGLADPPGKRD